MSVPLWRIALAAVYDGLALCGLIVTTALIAVAINGDAVRAGDLGFRTALLGVVAGYFVACWRRGQTLGMSAWTFEVVDRNGRAPGLARAALRWLYATINLALLGVGYWLPRLWSRDAVSYVDLLAGTRLRRRPPRG